jgi:hypothetical protein
MARIARNIELYNSAYSLAWKHISEHQKRDPNMARRLHDSIRRQLKDGATDPLFIASEALKALDETSEAVDAPSATAPSRPGICRRLLGMPFPVWWPHFLRF